MNWQAATAAALMCFGLASHAQVEKPNILVIFGDDIGYWNISTYHQGMMGYDTPNIDRIGKEGMFFTDAYGEQSCTAGRAAFITGQLPSTSSSGTSITSMPRKSRRTRITPRTPSSAKGTVRAV
jgi:arylsulfatase